MTIPTEPIGSIPRPLGLLNAIEDLGDCDHPDLLPLYEEATRDTIARFEATGSPVVTDGEQRKYHNFWTYCVHGMPNIQDTLRRGPRSPDAEADGGSVSLSDAG